MMIMLLWILAAVLLVGVSAFSTSPIRKHRVSLFMALDLPKDILLKGMKERSGAIL